MLKAYSDVGIMNRVVSSLIIIWSTIALFDIIFLTLNVIVGGRNVIIAWAIIFGLILWLIIFIMVLLGIVKSKLNEE